MNLIQFLNGVDESATKLPRKQLEQFIHHIARTLPSHQRDTFLMDLQSLDDKASTEADSETDLLQSIKKIQAELRLIESGEIFIIGNVDESYDDWYDDSEDDFIFEDPQNVLGIIEKACQLTHQCADAERYKECCALADLLFSLEIRVDGDYLDYNDEALTLVTLDENELGSFDYRQLVVDALHAAYWSNPLEVRPDTLYRMICNSGLRNITLETLIQSGRKELERLPDFLELWIQYLGNCAGRVAEKLLMEGVALQNDSVQTLQHARNFCAQHPELYEQILARNLIGGDDPALLRIGQEALDLIQPQYTVRHRIALLTAVFALRSNMQKEAEQCWLEAFRSDTTPVHYLRLVTESSDFSVYQDEVRRLYQHAYQASNTEKSIDARGALSRNVVDRHTYHTLAFFNGEFMSVIKDAMNVKLPLGWTSTFMKDGIALFLLYLYEGEELPVGCRTMCSQACASMSFTAQAYSQGLEQAVISDDATLFWMCFRKWKRLFKLLIPEQELIMKKLEAWIECRVTGILKEKRRNYYGECAAFVAALGEVKESRGEISGKSDLMESYRTAYPRHSTFAKALRAFGMRKN